MPEAALILLPILVAAWLPGWLAVRGLADNNLRPVERHFAALALGLALTGWIAFTLAELGLFSLAALGAVWLLAVLAIWALLERAQRRQRQNPPAENPQHPPRSLRLLLSSHAETLLLAVWLPAALWLFLRPHEMILGGADAGVYVSTAAHIARRGAILVQDTTVAQMDPALQAAVLRPIPGAPLTPTYLFPAFNVIDPLNGSILPDFFHYHPVWQAIAFALGDLAGGTLLAVHGALLMPGLWALLGAVAVYLTLRLALETSGAGRASRPAMLAAFLALAALSISAIQVWFARYPVAETLTQFLLWTGLWSLGGWLAQASPGAQRLRGLLAGVSLGLVLLTRIDLLFVLALPALAFLWQLARGRDVWRRRDNLWFYLPFTLLALHMALHSAFISRPYFARLLDYAQIILLRPWPVFVALALLGALLGWAILQRSPAQSPAGFARAIKFVTVIAVVALAAYAWFLRPVYGAAPSYQEWYDGQTIVFTDRENLVRLGWYLGPMGVWLGVAGICLMVWRADRRTIALVGVGLFFSLLYLWRIQANPHQIYAMRRYAPVVAPYFIVAAAALLHALWQPAGSWKARRFYVRSARVLALLLAIVWFGGIAWSARGFIRQVDNPGLTAQLVQLDAQLDENSVLLFDDQAPISQGDILGTPLRFFFGQDIFTLRDRQALDDALLVDSIESWQNSGRSVYWVGAPDWLRAHGFTVRPQAATLSTAALEGSYDHKPYRILPWTWQLTINKIEPR